MAIHRSSPPLARDRRHLAADEQTANIFAVSTARVKGVRPDKRLN